jgi:hypothetical protein
MEAELSIICSWLSVELGGCRKLDAATPPRPVIGEFDGVQPQVVDIANSVPVPGSLGSCPLGHRQERRHPHRSRSLQVPAHV